MPHWTDWTMWIAGWLTAALALALLLWALFADRSKGRPRCPKCWYSMAGAKTDPSAARTCPECGRTIRKPRHFHRTRRRWRPALVSLLVIFPLSYALWATPRIKSEGWTGAVPTTALIAALPWLDSLSYDEQQRAASNVLPDSLSKQLYWRLQNRIAGSLQRVQQSPQRILSLTTLGGTWRWQRLLLARQLAIGDSSRRPCTAAWHHAYDPIADELLGVEAERVHNTPRYRRLWAMTSITVPNAVLPGEELVVKFTPPASDGPTFARLKRIDESDVEISRDIYASHVMVNYGGGWSWEDRFQPLGLVPGDISHEFYIPLHVEVRNRTAEHPQPLKEWEQSVRLPVRVVAAPHDVIAPLRSDILTLELERELQPRLLVCGEEGWLSLNDEAYWSGTPEPSVLDALADSGCTFAVRVEVLSGDEVVCVGHAWWNIKGPPKVYEYGNKAYRFFSIAPSRMSIIKVAVPPRPKGKDDLQLRITGDPIVAMRDPEAKAYWDDTILISLPIIRREQRPSQLSDFHFPEPE